MEPYYFAALCPDTNLAAYAVTVSWYCAAGALAFLAGAACLLLRSTLLHDKPPPLFLEIERDLGIERVIREPR